MKLSKEMRAALKLTALLLRRSQTSASGYGYTQTWDAAQLGLVEGNSSKWTITRLGEDILKLEESVRAS